MLSAHTGISSRAYDSGLPTLRDSISASSSACSSIASASFRSISARSPGVVSSHSGSAFFAAWTARSTSSALARGTSAIVSPVAGLRTSIVSPLAESTHSPPTKFLCCSVVTLIACLLNSDGSSLHGRDFCALRRGGGLRRRSDHAGVACQSLGDRHRHDRQRDDGERDHVDDRELLPLAQVVPDEDR